MELRSVDIELAPGRVSGLFLAPPDPRALYVLAHGAGAGMRHPFLERVAQGLAGRGIATLRYQFPYMEAQKRRPDPPAVAAAPVRAAARRARELEPGLPLIAGGKSFGGRMTSTAQATEPLPGVTGLAFLGFPLHPPGRPGIERAAHLERVAIPMLFLQGTRDEFAKLELMRQVTSTLAAAALHLVEGGDHSFHVLKRQGRTDEQAMEEVLDAMAGWIVRGVSNVSALVSRRMPNHWVLKTEPTSYSYDDLERDGHAVWDGVKNPVALRNLRTMAKGDQLLIYHTGDEKAVIGLARVTREAYPDPQHQEGNLVVVEIAPVKRLRRPVPLAEIRKDKTFATIALVRAPRLSVVPADERQWKRLLELGGA
jgi:hypothetical protein